MRWSKFIPNCFKIVEVRTEIIYRTSELANLTDEQIQDQLKSLVQDQRWKYLEEFLRRMRDRYSSEIAKVDTIQGINRTNGRISFIDYLLTLKHTAV